MATEENITQTVAQIVAQTVAQTADASAKVVAQVAQDAAIVLAKDNYATNTAIAVLQTEMKVLKNQQVSLETNINKKVDELTPKFEKIFEKLDEVAQGHPTWAVAIVITTLCSVCSGMIAFILLRL